MTARSSAVEGNTEMTKSELLEYITNKPCYCCLCSHLKTEVLKSGIDVIPEYRGMICGSIEDMLIRYGEVEET